MYTSFFVLIRVLFICYNDLEDRKEGTLTMKLVTIHELTETTYQSYVSSFLHAEEPLSPSSLDVQGQSYEYLVKKLATSKEEAGLIPGHVPSETLFLVADNGYILGAIHLRYGITEELLRYGGHMSFSIRPEERRKGYAFIMIKLSLNHLRAQGIFDALVTVNRKNQGAKNTLKKIGGVLENAYETNGLVIDRYWIKL